MSTTSKANIKILLAIRWYIWNIIDRIFHHFFLLQTSNQFNWCTVDVDWIMSGKIPIKSISLAIWNYEFQLYFIAWTFDFPLFDCVVKIDDSHHCKIPMVLNAVRLTMNRIPFPYRALILRKQLFPPHKHSLTNLLVLHGAVYKREHFKFLPHKVYKRNGVQFTNAFFQLSSKLKKRRRNRRNITCLLLNRCTFPEQ